MKKRFVSAVVGALAMTLALGACSAEEPEPVVVTATPEVEADKVAPPEPAPVPEAPIVWPLTGVPVEEVAQRPALSIKIENSPVSRPQTGLEYADIVWEQIVEGGISRFVATYHSQIPDRVLPVRSARPMDNAIVAPTHGLLAFSGAQPRFIDMIEQSGIQAIVMDRGNAGFGRERSRRAPHNAWGNPQAFLDQANDSRTVPPPAQFTYAAEVGKGTASTAGTPAANLDVRMSGAQRTQWDWDAASGTYLRSNGTTPSVSTSGARHAARNVVLLEVHVDDHTFGIPWTKMVGEGRAVVASGGKSIEATWSKAGDAEVVVLKDAAGNVVELDPGATWINLVPTSGSWEIG